MPSIRLRRRRDVLVSRHPIARRRRWTSATRSGPDLCQFPEPGTIALLGLALLGIDASRVAHAADPAKNNALSHWPASAGRFVLRLGRRSRAGETTTNHSTCESPACSRVNPDGPAVDQLSTQPRGTARETRTPGKQPGADPRYSPHKTRLSGLGIDATVTSGCDLFTFDPPILGADFHEVHAYIQPPRCPVHRAIPTLTTPSRPR